MIDKCLVCGRQHEVAIVCPDEGVSLEQHVSALATDELTPCPRCAELEAENKRLTGLELERTVERDEARRFGEEAGQRYNALLIASCDVTCAFCGATYPRGTPRHGDGALADHIKVCLKHPMREAEAALRERDGRYHELLYAVGHKFPDESRHDTALRYIRQAEVPDGKQEGQMMSSLPAAETEGDTT